MTTVYVASKSQHGHMWLAYRDAWSDLGLKIVSTWIDEWQPGASGSMTDLWERCVSEAASADFLVCCVWQGETLKGALVEIGAALAHGRPVYVCRFGQWSGLDGDRLGSWVNHPLITLAADPDDAIEDYRARFLGEWSVSTS